MPPSGTGVLPTGGGTGPLLSPPPPHDASVMSANPMYQCFLVTPVPSVVLPAVTHYSGSDAESGTRLRQQQDSSPPRTVNGDKTTVKSWVVSRGQFLFLRIAILKLRRVSCGARRSSVAG